jgi:hypothetical protein
MGFQRICKPTFQRDRAGTTKSSTREATLIAPYWSTAPWFPNLLRMAIEEPIMLPDWNDLFTPGRQDHLPTGNPKWRALAWRVSGNHLGRRIFERDG